MFFLGANNIWLSSCTFSFAFNACGFNVHKISTTEELICLVYILNNFFNDQYIKLEFKMRGEEIIY